MEPKYKLIDVTQEEKKDFLLKFDALLKETSMYYEPVPQFARETLAGPWKLVCNIYIAKKVIDNGPDVKVEDIPSSIQPNESIPTAD